jgi:hypothetical protein
MLHDAATLPSTYVARVVTTPSPEAGGRVLAPDLASRHTGPLWLRGHDLPVGTVVCFTNDASGPRVGSCMTSRLWRACEREAARVDRRPVRARHERMDEFERRVGEAATNIAAEAEQLLRDRRSL